MKKPSICEGFFDRVKHEHVFVRNLALVLDLLPEHSTASWLMNEINKRK